MKRKAETYIIILLKAILLAAILTSSASASLDAKVCHRYSSIEAAVEAANAGDTITLEAGIYKESIHISKSLTIKGAGAGKTIIDGGGEARVFNVGRDQAGILFPDVDVAISGMTIQNGRAEDDPLPSENPDSRFGGGIFNAGTLTLRDCLIKNNIAEASWEGGGGGIMNYGKKLTLERCVLSNNKALESNNAYGAAILNWHDRGEMYPQLNVIDSVITKNVAVAGNEYYYSYSGGIWNWGTCSVVRSIISSNEARFGGGIENYGDLIVDGSSIHGNLANQDGGGIANWGRGTLNCTVKNSDIAKNTAKRYGGGIYNDGVLSLQNSLILENSATNGGGIASTTGHKPVVHGTIILYNEPNNNAVV
jgi:hypothetical protein